MFLTKKKEWDSKIPLFELVNRIHLLCKKASSEFYENSLKYEFPTIPFFET